MAAWWRFAFSECFLDIIIIIIIIISADYSNRNAKLDCLFRLFTSCCFPLQYYHNVVTSRSVLYGST